MAQVIKTVDGANLLQPDISNYNFYCSDQENLLFYPGDLPDGEAVDGLAQHTFHPRESQNVGWLKTTINWTRSTTMSQYNWFTADFELYGVDAHGYEHFIGSQRVTSIDSTPTTENIYFDLKGGSGHPTVRRESGNVASSGRVRLNLPWNLENLDYAYMESSISEGYGERRALNIVNDSSTPLYDHVVCTNVVHDPNMGSIGDWTDIQWVDSDGRTRLCKYVDPNYKQQHPSSPDTLNMYVRVPYLPANTTKTIYMDYSSDLGLGMQSNGDGVFPMFEDWSLGVIPDDWYLDSPGTPYIVSTPFSNMPYTTYYACEFEGSSPNTATPNGLARHLPTDLQSTSYTGVPQVIEFDFELVTPGYSTPNDPRISLMHWRWNGPFFNLVLDTLYVSPYQQLRLGRFSGVTPAYAGFTTMATMVYYTGPIPNGYKIHLTVLDTGSKITVFSGYGWKMFGEFDYSSYASPVTPGTIAFGTHAPKNTGRWSNIRVYKWDYKDATSLHNSDVKFNPATPIDNPYYNFADTTDLTYMWDTAGIPGAYGTPSGELAITCNGVNRYYMATKHPYKTGASPPGSQGNYGPSVYVPYNVEFAARRHASGNFEFTFGWDGSVASPPAWCPPVYGFQLRAWPTASCTSLELLKYDPVTGVIIATTPIVTDTTQHIYRVEHQRWGINVFRDNATTPCLSYTGSSVRHGGKLGFGCRELPAGATVYFDNIKVGDLLTNEVYNVSVTPIPEADSMKNKCPQEVANCGENNTLPNYIGWQRGPVTSNVNWSLNKTTSRFRYQGLSSFIFSSLASPYVQWVKNYIGIVDGYTGTPWTFSAYFNYDVALGTATPYVYINYYDSSLALVTSYTFQPSITYNEASPTRFSMTTTPPAGSWIAELKYQPTWYGFHSMDALQFEMGSPATYWLEPVYSGDSNWVEFITPSVWMEGQPWYFRIKEKGNTEYRTSDVQINCKDSLRLGYDNVDKYVAIRTKVKVHGGEEDSIRVNYIEHGYEV